MITGDAILANAAGPADMFSRYEPLDWRDAETPAYAYVAPFLFRASNDGQVEPGAVTAYFDSPPTPDDEHLLAEAAKAFPVVLAAVADRPALLAVDMATDLLARLDRGPLMASIEDVHGVLEEMCVALANSLRCREAMIQLDQAPGRPEQAWLCASNREGSATPEADRAFIAWVLANGKPAWFPNLRHTQEQEMTIRARYPGADIDFKRLIGIGGPKELELRVLQRRAEPILSWLAVPISAGPSVFGAIRCSLAIDEPSHFFEREQRTVQLVADVLAHFWKAWVQAGRLQSIIDEVLALNATAHEQLAHRVVSRDLTMSDLLVADEHIGELFDEALRRVELLVEPAAITSIRALDISDPNDRYLDFVRTRGSEWDSGSAGEIRARRTRRFPVDRPDDPSLGRLVVLKGAALRVDNVHAPPPGSKCIPTFPQTYAMACVPIRLGGQVLGVLDLRSTKHPFSDLDIQAAESVAAQLGLYFGLAEAFYAQARRLAEDQQMVEDLVHQLASPLLAAEGALNRVDRTIGNLQQSVSNMDNMDVKTTLSRVDKILKSQERDLRLATRLVTKSAKTARTAKLFRQLADPGRAVACDPIGISPSHLATLLRQAVEDAKLLTAESRRLTYDLRARASFGTVWFDPEQLEQCLGQILDNARKYAFDGSTVIVEAARWDTGAARVGVTSTGTPLDRVDVPKCIRRGWRGPDATFVTAEGQGIGLFIVDRVVEANGGKLVVTPSGDVTRVDVLLPRRP